MSQPPKLLDQVRQRLRFKHMSLSTEKSYVYYIKDYILFHRKPHPKEMGVDEVRVPVVFTRTEVKAILSKLTGTPHLIASLLYGAGLRLNECLRLRVKDIDFEYCQITVRDGKGEKDRVTI